MQNNYKGNPDQAASNPNGKAKFSCDDCSFSCNSLQNFRIHLQIVHHKSSESIQALGTVHKAVPEKPKCSVVLEAQPVMYVQGKPKGSEDVKAQPAIPKLNQMVQAQPVLYVQAKPKGIEEVKAQPVLYVQGKPKGSIEVKAQPAKTKWSGVVAAQPEKPKWSGVVPAQPAKTKWSGVVPAQPEKPKWSGVVAAQPEKPKWSGVVPAQPEKPKWSGVVPAQPEKPKGGAMETQPEKPKEKAVVKPQPEKLKGRLLVRALPEKANVMAKALPEKPKWKAVVEDQPEKPKWKPIVEAQPGTSGRNITKLKDYIARTDREPLIGLEYVLEYSLKKGNEIEIKYFCHLCECDTDVDPMVEHLAGFGHRKLYLPAVLPMHSRLLSAKEYPYVLKAQPNSKDEQSQFLRRMALEIEREEGTKMYMINSSIWTETVMTLRTADKKMRKKTRWDDNKNDETRMKKALKFLETFEIESEIEATTVSRLCEKLTANLKFYNTKSKEDVLFPARVARAQDVAMALMRNVAKQRLPLQNPAQKPKPQISPQLNTRPPPLQGNANLTHNVGMQSGFPGANFQKFNIKQNMPKATPYPQGQQYPFGPPNQKQAMQGPSMQMKEPPQKAENTQPGDSFMKNLNQEDTQFFKKLMSLLDALPQNASLADSSQMNSKLLMLKSLLVDQKSAEHEQANQKLMMQIASMVKDTISAQNASLNQQLMMLMTSQNSTSMVMQTASLRNNLLGPDGMSSAGFVQGIQSSGNIQTNINSLMPFNQNIGSQMYGQTGRIGLGPVDQSAYQVPQVDMQSFPSSSQNYPSMPQKYPGTSQNHPSTSQNFPSTSQNFPSTSQNYPSTSQNYPSTSQNYDDFAYRNSVEGNFSRQGEPYVSKRDGIANTLTAGQNERTTLTHTDEPSMYDKELDNSYYSNPSKQVPESRYNDRMEKQASYTRVCLSPTSPRNQYADYNENPRGEIGIQEQRQRHSLRSYNSSNWDDQEDDTQYIKRARLDLDNRSDRSESYSNQSLESFGMNSASMPEELLKRIKGKDLFTTSAIISEYSERHSGK